MFEEILGKLWLRALWVWLVWKDLDFDQSFKDAVSAYICLQSMPNKRSNESNASSFSLEHWKNQSYEASNLRLTAAGGGFATSISNNGEKVDWKSGSPQKGTSKKKKWEEFSPRLISIYKGLFHGLLILRLCPSTFVLQLSFAMDPQQIVKWVP